MGDRSESLDWRRISLFALVALVAILGLGSIYLHRIDATIEQNTSPLNQEALAPPAASIRYLPNEIQIALRSLCDGCSFADSNGSWSATDVISDERLPRRRITRTEKQGDSWLIEYEHGGIATFQYTVVLSATSQPRLLGGSSCIPKPEQPCNW